MPDPPPFSAGDAPPDDHAPEKAAREAVAPEELCVCFHVPLQKVAKFVRLTRPRLATQCSECYGAGTGCGWCIPFIEKLHEQIMAGEDNPHISLSPEEYRRRRRDHLRRIGGGRRPDDGLSPD